MLKKDLSNAIVHYEEVKEHFPKEFKQLGLPEMMKMDDELQRNLRIDPMG